MASRENQELGPRVNNNGWQDRYNAHSRKPLSCKIVHNCREFSNRSNCRPDRAMNNGMISRTSMIGSSFQSSSTTRSIRCSFIWYLLSLIKRFDVPSSNKWESNLEMARGLWAPEHSVMILHGPTLSRFHAQDVHSKLKGCVYLPAFTTQSSSRARTKKIDRLFICVKTVAFTKVH